MKYALISDIHGNYPALRAVLKDAHNRGVNKYLFLGDYVEDLPWPNEVVNLIKETKPAVVIRGNKEDYLRDIHSRSMGEMEQDQMAAIYWNYKELSAENLEYLMSLPDEAEILDNEGGLIKIAHTSPIFYRTPKIDIFYSTTYMSQMMNAPFTHEEFLCRVYEQACNDPRVMAELDHIRWKVNAFGHSHLQWHFTHKGVLHINPGSCGMPLDFNTDAPYSLIEFVGGKWNVEEARVKYNVIDTADRLKGSSLYRFAEAWSEIVAESLVLAQERISFFLKHVINTSRELGRPSWPVDNDAWRQAVNILRHGSKYAPVLPNRPYRT